jgi:hypothetical protein
MLVQQFDFKLSATSKQHSKHSPHLTACYSMHNAYNRSFMGRLVMHIRELLVVNDMHRDLT